MFLDFLEDQQIAALIILPVGNPSNFAGVFQNDYRWLAQAW